jgi:hypothetical protein
LHGPPAGDARYNSIAHRRPTLDAELAADEFSPLPLNNDWLLSESLPAELTAPASEHELATALDQRLLKSLTVDTEEASVAAVSRHPGLLAATAGRLDRVRDNSRTPSYERGDGGTTVAHAHPVRLREAATRSRDYRDSERARELLRQRPAELVVHPASRTRPVACSMKKWM